MVLSIKIPPHVEELITTFTINAAGHILHLHQPNPVADDPTPQSSDNEPLQPSCPTNRKCKKCLMCFRFFRAVSWFYSPCFHVLTMTLSWEYAHNVVQLAAFEISVLFYASFARSSPLLYLMTNGLGAHGPSTNQASSLFSPTNQFRKNCSGQT